MKTLIGRDPCKIEAATTDSSFSLKDTKEVPAIPPLFKPTLINRLMCQDLIQRLYSVVLYKT